MYKYYRYLGLPDSVEEVYAKKKHFSSFPTWTTFVHRLWNLNTSREGRQRCLNLKKMDLTCARRGVKQGTCVLLVVYCLILFTTFADTLSTSGKLCLIRAVIFKCVSSKVFFSPELTFAFPLEGYCSRKQTSLFRVTRNFFLFWEPELTWCRNKIIAIIMLRKPWLQVNALGILESMIVFWFWDFPHFHNNITITFQILMVKWLSPSINCFCWVFLTKIFDCFILVTSKILFAIFLQFNFTFILNKNFIRCD